MAIFVGAIKKKIILNVGVDINGAILMQIKYRKPDGTVGFWTANKESSTSISYITATTRDLDRGGTWKFQAYIETPDWSDHGNIVELNIKEVLT